MYHSVYYGEGREVMYAGGVPIGFLDECERPDGFVGPIPELGEFHQLACQENTFVFGADGLVKFYKMMKF